MRHILVAVVAVVMLTTAVILGGPRSSRMLAAQESTPVASPTADATSAELKDLRNRVAALSTQVAMLGGADPEALQGRLGGLRAGFDDLYGRPTAYLSADEVAYEIPGLGSLTVDFVADRAVQITIAPTGEGDAAAWPEEAALAAASQLFPADAIVTEPSANGERAILIDGVSEALSGAMAAADAQGCRTGGATPFTAILTRSGPEAIAAAVIETAPPGEATPLPAAPVAAQAGRLSEGSSRAVANSSLGGTVSVNGLRLIAAIARPDAQGPRPAAAGHQFYTVELQLQNNTGQALAFEPADFILVDRRGQESAAICGGVEPAIARGELAPGAAIDGVVTFEVPERFRPERFVVLVNGARVGFLLR